MNDKQMTARRVLSLLDLTSLRQTDNEESIVGLCRNASTFSGQVAAVCVLPQFVQTAKNALAQADCAGVKVATVSNFPAGGVNLVEATESTAQAVADGANEVDLVFPWRSLMAGDAMVGDELIRASRRACGDKVRLKVIIESGMLAAPAFIRQASEICLDAGVDFIKTSTGTESVNATPDAVRLIAQVIKESGLNRGIKVSGGISSVADAERYLVLAENVLGNGWATPNNFRFGASSLLQALQSVISGEHGEDQTGDY